MKELIKIQSELKCNKTLYNNFGKYYYRSAETILEAVKPLLKDNDCLLTISDEVINLGTRFYVRASVIFLNPEGKTITVTAYAREEETKKGMDGAQITGAASSYARKYALNGLFAIDDTKESDTTNKEKVLPELNPESDKWEKAVEHCTSKGIEGILKKYHMTEENIDIMLNCALESGI